MGRLISGPGFFRLALAMVVFAHHVSRIALGSAAVYLFFVLSGFWIARMWRSEYVQTRHPYFTFAVSRLWRLWPVFVFTSGAGAVGWAISGKPVTATLIASTLGILGYSTQQVPNVPGWSLDIELQFYAMAPLLIWLGAWRQSALAGLAMVTAFAWLSPGLPHLLRYLPFFLIGVLQERESWRPSKRAAALGATLAIAALCAVALSPWRGALLGGAHPTAMFVFNEPLNIAAALLFAPLALWTVGNPSDRTDAMFGAVSYTLYMTHWFACLWLGAHVAGLSSPERAILTALAMMFTTGAAWGLWWAIDRPLNAWRRAWVRKRRAYREPVREEAGRVLAAS